MCKECKSECIGAKPCERCRKNTNYGDLLAIISIVVVAYLWAIAG